MRKIGLIVVALGAFGLSALGGMDNVPFGSGTTIAASTSTVSYVIRGELEGIHIDVGTATTRTQTVTVASEQMTLFTKACTADAMYLPRYAMHGNTGSAITFNTYSATNMAAGVTAAQAQTWYGKAPLAGKITVTVVGNNGASKTNTTAVTLIVNK
jgi:hypothetical protein